MSALIDGSVFGSPRSFDITVTLLVVVGKAPLPQLAPHFVATVPRITKFLAKHTPPLIAKVYRPSPEDLAKNPDAAGTVALWYPIPGKARDRK